jgi:hypothetical protein
VGIAAVIVLVWAGLSAHHASAKLKEVHGAAAVITVATTKPTRTVRARRAHSPGQHPGELRGADLRAHQWLSEALAGRHRHPVKAGQLLAEIESPEVDQQLRQAEADLATAEANQKIADLTAQRWRNLRVDRLRLEAGS